MMNHIVEIMEVPEAVCLYGIVPPDKEIKGNIGIVAAIIVGITAFVVGIAVFIRKKVKKKRGENSNEEVKK